MNIVEPVFFQCKYHAPALAICAPGTELDFVSYGRLEVLINNACRKLSTFAVAPGSTIAVAVADRILHAVILLALARLGAVTLSVRTPVWPKHLRIDAVIADAGQDFSLGMVWRADASWLEGDGEPVGEEWQGRGHDACRIVLTAAANGEAEAIALSHDMIETRIAQQAAFGPLWTYCARPFCNLDLSTDLGFQLLVATLWRGGAVFLPGDNAEATLRAFKLDRVQSVATTPAGLARLLDMCKQSRPPPSELRAILLAGSRLPDGLAERAHALLSPNLVIAYGAAETGVVASMPRRAAMPGEVGYVAPGVTVEIVDLDGQSVPSGTEGALRIRGDGTVGGYMRRGEAGGAFRDDWFYPGDSGALSRTGMLTITGRDQRLATAAWDKIDTDQPAAPGMPASRPSAARPARPKAPW